MHEMSIAQSVLEIAIGEMEKNAASSVRKIKISIGQFSGVVKEALEFAFDVLKPETPAAAAEIEIAVIEIKAECPVCGPTECRLNDLNLFCPICNAVLKISAGREMTVDYLDVE
jgi:hydrogenase nickel incorporation protein HypA/HybF